MKSAKYVKSILILWFMIAELAEHSPTIIQNSSNPSSQKNLDVQPYDHMTVQGATFDMRVQLYVGMPMPRLCPVVQWSVHWAPSRTTWVLVLARARRFALEMCGKKMRALLLGLVKSIYYLIYILWLISTNYYIFLLMFWWIVPSSRQFLWRNNTFNR